jgi:hypothetical protein
MKSNIFRVSFIGVIVVSLLIVAGLTDHSKAQVQSDDPQSFIWGISPTQIARVCLANAPNPNDPPPTETISVYFVAIKNQSGQTVIQRELRIPVGEFRCTDFTLRQLEDAGLPTDRPPKKTFLIFCSGPNTASQQTVGSIETIDIESGQSRIYLGIHWRSDAQ